MRRVKSAPANLASMSNNKKDTPNCKINYNSLPLFISSKNIESKNNINNIENSNLFNNVLNLNSKNKEKSLLLNKNSKYSKYSNFKSEKIKNIKKNINIPVVGIGGVSLENQGLAYDAGCDAVAMIDGLFGH